MAAQDSTGLVSTGQDSAEPDRRPRLLIVTGDTIGARIAGPAIRVLSIARQASAFADVTVASFVHGEQGDHAFEVVTLVKGDVPHMLRLLDAHDAVMLQGNAMHVFGELISTDKVVIADIYDPMNLAFLEQFKGDEPSEYAAQVSRVTEVMTVQLRRADFMVCASERQRDYYLGMLAALGRIDTTNYAASPDLRGLIDVVPFGLDPNPPVRGDHGLRDTVEGVGPDDKVLLWSGGLYNWFDPDTLVRAVAQVATRHDDVRLVFMGTKHPNPDIPEMDIIGTTRELAKELGVWGSSVLFNDTWVPFDERAGFLLDADVGVSTHPVHIETAFSFRTRMLDYLWAGLPIIATEGDYFADLIRDEGLGAIVGERDVDALAAAIERMLYDDEWRASCIEQVMRVRERFSWDLTLAPLMAFLADPRPAADRERVMRGFGIGVQHAAPVPASTRAQQVRAVLRHEGVGGLVRRVARRIRSRARG